MATPKETGGDALLAAIGIHVVTDEDGPAVRAECSRIARQLVNPDTRVVGLLPATSDVAVPALAVQLGLALVDLTGATVAVIDANIRWPALSPVADAEAPESAAPAGTVTRSGTVGDEAIFATRWLRGSLALLTPPHAGVAGAGLPQLARAIRHGSELFAYMVVDLTGFEQLGEHLAAIELVQGVLLVGRAGRTRESELLRWKREIPTERNLGVLLVGGR